MPFRVQIPGRPTRWATDTALPAAERIRLRRLPAVPLSTALSLRER